jgi:hypothetical protein
MKNSYQVIDVPSCFGWNYKTIGKTHQRREKLWVAHMKFPEKKMSLLLSPCTPSPELMNLA